MTESGIRVLIIDDDASLRRMLRVSLSVQNYAVIEAGRGEQAIEATLLERPDLIVLDLKLPDMPGLVVVRELREWTNTPIIILSVEHDEATKIASLDAGADDYLTKPFSMGELLARIRVALRHIPQPEEMPVFETGELEVDLVRRQVKVSGHEVQLTPKEYDLLKMLVIHAGKVVTQRQLLRELWGEAYEREVHVLRVHMSNLRAKIESDPAQPRYIITESGVGYRLRVEGFGSG